MKHQLRETPRDRLQRIMSYGLPYRREVPGPKYLVAVGLLILVVTMLVVATIAGSGAVNMVRVYIERLGSL